jgi:3',5'-cyclic AMP phosphodiesterase CpdA
MKKTYLILSFFLCPFLLQAQVNLPDTLMTNFGKTANSLYKFTFIHLTDIHIGEGADGGDYGTPGYDDEPPVGDIGYPAQRLRNTVRWINEFADSLKIKFVIVSGDLTDSGERSEFLKFKEIIDSLKIPYIPHIGNHDVWPYTSSSQAPAPNGDEIINEVFSDQYDFLKNWFPYWNDGTRLIQTWNPEANVNCYFQNFAFKYDDYHFVLGDYNPRNPAAFNEPGIGPEAQLHNFQGGSWPWMKNYIDNIPDKGNKNVIVVTHHPPTKDPWAAVNAFSYGEYDAISKYVATVKDHVAMWFAGHIHRAKTYGISQWTNNTFLTLGVETAANKDFENGHFRIVNVYEDVTGIKEEKNNFVFKIIPNPNSGLFRLYMKDVPENDIEIKIMDMKGKTVRHFNMKNSGLIDTEIDLSKESKGIYFIKVKGKNFSKIEKLVIY